MNGIYAFLDKEKNDLVVNVSLINGKSNQLRAKNIPIQKWLNITISVDLRNVDLFVNAKLISSKKLDTLPEFGLNPIIINPYGGFSGSIGNFKFYNYAADINLIYKIFKKGYQSYNPFNKTLDRAEDEFIEMGQGLGLDGGERLLTPRKKDNTGEHTYHTKYFNEECSSNIQCIGDLKCIHQKCTFKPQSRKKGELCVNSNDCQIGFKCNNIGYDNLNNNALKKLKYKGIKISNVDKYNKTYGKPFSCYKI